MTYSSAEDASCLTLGVTGVFGCVWDRNKDRKTTWCQVFWFCLTFYIWLEASVFLHWTIAMHNDEADINAALTGLSGTNACNCWYELMRVFSLVIFVYVTLVTLFGLLHVYSREPLYMSVWHRLLVVLCVMVIYSFEIVVVYARTQEWKLLLLSLDVTGPYLHVFLVMFAAVLTWPIAWYWLRWNSGSRIYLLLLYVVTLVLLYIWPVVIHTPITVYDSSLPAKPKLIANRGVPELAPENTLLSIEEAANFKPMAVLLDVWVSHDGTPFVLHDSTLTRTTNVAEEYPDRAGQHAAYWKMSELRKLDAGSWFIKAHRDQLPTARQIDIAKEKIPELSMALTKLDSVVINVRKEGVEEDHPFFDNYEQRIVNVVLGAAITEDKVYWLGMSPERKFQSWANNVTDSTLAEDLVKETYNGVSAPYWQIGERFISECRKLGLLTNVLSVNTEWLLTLYWTMGASAVTTDSIQELAGVQRPSYTLHPNSYLTMWVLADVVSILLVLVFWFVNYMINVTEQARKETVLMEDVTDKVSYVEEFPEPPPAYGTPPVPDVGSGLPRKTFPYEATDDGFQ